MREKLNNNKRSNFKMDKECYCTKDFYCGNCQDKDMLEIIDLETENAELHEALDTLRAEINEIKLVNSTIEEALGNSKMDFINKIFKTNTLSESQKYKIVEGFENILMNILMKN